MPKYVVLASHVLIAMTPFAWTSTAGDTKPKPTLDDTVRQWHKGMASAKKDEREKTLRAMLPEQKDIETLFPKQAEKLKPIFAKRTAELLSHLDEIAKEMTKSGAIQTVTVVDMRKNDSGGQCKRLFEIIPKDVQVARISIRYTNGDGSGSEFYVLVNGRWRWIGGLNRIPEFLDKLK